MRVKCYQKMMKLIKLIYFNNIKEVLQNDTFIAF